MTDRGDYLPPPPYIHERAAKKDFRTVSDVELSPERGEVFMKLFSSNCTPGEARDWYFGQDPTSEVTNEIIERNLRIDTARTILGERLHAEALSQAGALLMTSVTFPELFQDPNTSTSWREHLVAKFNQSHPNTPAYGELPPEKIVQFALEDLDYNSISAQELQNMATASDMFEDAFKTKHFWHSRLIGVDTLIERMTGMQQRKTMAQSAMSNLTTARSIRSSIIYAGLDRRSPTYDEKTKIALRTEWHAAAFELGRLDTLEPAAQGIFSKLITDLEKAFITTKALENRAIRADTKGMLHELLWMLDGHMLRLSDNKYEGIKVYPVLGRQDAPEVGRPESRRGYDYTIMGNGLYTRIQLKSSPQQSKTKYHQDIRVAAEENFLDNNSNRLKGKLGSYKRIVANQFQDPDTSKVLGKFILPTVRAEMDEHYRQSQAVATTHTAQFAAVAIERQPRGPNRKQRRQAKKLGRRASES